MDKRDVFAQQLVMSMEEAKLSYSKYTTQVRNCIHQSRDRTLGSTGQLLDLDYEDDHSSTLAVSFRQIKTAVHTDLVRSRV